MNDVLNGASRKGRSTVISSHEINSLKLDSDHQPDALVEGLNFLNENPLLID